MVLGGQKKASRRQISNTDKKGRGDLLAPPEDFGVRLFSSLRVDMSSEETGGRRRRAYTEIDDLLNDDLKQGETAFSDQELNRQRQSLLSDKGSNGRNRGGNGAANLSSLGGSRGKITSQFIKGLAPEECLIKDIKD